MVQHLCWATGENVIAIHLATGILYGAGILLTPAAGAIPSWLARMVGINAHLLVRLGSNMKGEATLRQHGLIPHGWHGARGSDRALPG